MYRKEGTIVPLFGVYSKNKTRGQQKSRGNAADELADAQAPVSA
jgi:hypothetical protein